MSKRIMPDTIDGQNARTANAVSRQQNGTPRSRAIKDDNGKVRVRIGRIDATHYGVRVYNSDGTTAYDFTSTV